MASSRVTLLYSTALIAVGIGIGSSSTVLIQRTIPSQPPAGVQQPTAPPSPKLTTALLLEGEPALGSAQAPLTIVEFSDFECSYCQRFHRDVLPALKQNYIDTGLVRFVHKDLPLPFHQQAIPAATAARCAAEQNNYWRLYAALFDQQTCLNCKGVVAIAAEQGFNPRKLQACMQTTATQTQINANISEAALHNIRATPTFVIGPTLANGKHEGEVIEGALPWPRFRALIDQKLKALKRQ